MSETHLSRIVIFGNSGSGKSTLARSISATIGCNHLDLDTIAWDANRDTPTRLPVEESQRTVDAFLAENESWIIEGCYADLLDLVIPHSTEIIFLNPGIETCIENCRNRPWEPHKYESPEAQDANLELLVAWIRQYDERTDEFSLRAHRRIFDSYPGKRLEYTSNRTASGRSAGKDEFR